MHTFTANSTARQLPPRSVFIPSAAAIQRRSMPPLVLLERHLCRTGMAASRLGRIIANDSRLIFDMRNGREPTGKVVEQIASYFAEACHA